MTRRVVLSHLFHTNSINIYFITPGNSLTCLFISFICSFTSPSPPSSPSTPPSSPSTPSPTQSSLPPPPHHRCCSKCAASRHWLHHRCLRSLAACESVGSCPCPTLRINHHPPEMAIVVTLRLAPPSASPLAPPPLHRRFPM